MTLHWHIQGFDSTSPIFDIKIKYSDLGVKQLEALLMALTARSEHSYEEIVGGYVRRRSKLANDLLQVRKGGLHPVYTCGINPHFIARVTGDA